MRQAYYFNGNNYINVTGISKTFWRDSNWSVAALVKIGDLSKPNSNECGNECYDIAVLGVGARNASLQDELLLGFRGKKGDTFVSISILSYTAY